MLKTTSDSIFLKSAGEIRERKMIKKIGDWILFEKWSVQLGEKVEIWEGNNSDADDAESDGACLA